MKVFVVLNTQRSGYGLDQLGSTMTVGELISALQSYDEDDYVAFKNDNGYTYGEITYDCIEEEVDDLDEEPEEE